jgi:hypothetical protein
MALLKNIFCSSSGLFLDDLAFFSLIFIYIANSTSLNCCSSMSVGYLYSSIFSIMSGSVLVPCGAC